MPTCSSTLCFETLGLEIWNPFVVGQLLSAGLYQQVELEEDSKVKRKGIFFFLFASFPRGSPQPPCNNTFQIKFLMGTYGTQYPIIIE